MEDIKQETHHRETHVHGEKTSTMHKLLIGAAVIQIVLLLFIAFKVGSIGSAGVANVPNVPLAPGEEAPAPVVNMEKLVDTDAVLGDEDAPVTIVEFSDYQCPFCGRFYQQTLPQLKSQYIDTGKVKLIFRDYPLPFHAMAEPAAIAAECAGKQGKYYALHDKIFANQELLSEATLKQWAQEIGLNSATWEKCRADPAIKQEVAKDMQDGSAAGVQGTPAFFVNGRLISGAQPFAAFQQVIEQALAE
ncbi:DsbA family protein [Candidatus Woesearchaeota archaeon]|nr:DsbA family protein [Candidatus Woesearchaeota archaeon]